MQSLIEQVRKCADLQKKWGTTSCFILDANMNARFNVDFPALLAHLERMQAVAGPFIIVLSDRQYVYGVMEHGANALHTVRSFSEVKPLRKHGYIKCPACGVKLAWPYDERCDWCNCPFWPSAGHYSAQEAEKRRRRK